MQAVPERQAHQTTTREEKTRKRALEALRDTFERHGEKLEALNKERDGLTERKDEVRKFLSSNIAISNRPIKNSSKGRS